MWISNTHGNSQQDLRNHGDSPHNSQHDYLCMARDVEAFIIAHSLKNSTIIGHSMGAKTAMMLALVSPTLVHDVVSVDNAPIRNMFQDDFASYIRGMKLVEEQNVFKQSEADKILQNFVKVGFGGFIEIHINNTLITLRIQSLSVRQFLLGNFYHTEKGILRSKVPLDILNHSLENLRDFPIRDSSIKKFINPALFIRGTKSRYVTDDMFHEIEKFFPRYKLVDVEASHWLISENPEDFRKGKFN